jgi:hypothetical protein
MGWTENLVGYLKPCNVNLLQILMVHCCWCSVDAKYKVVIEGHADEISWYVIILSDNTAILHDKKW